METESPKEQNKGMIEQIGISHNVTAKIYCAKTKKLLSTIKARNRVPDAGLNAHVDLMGGTGREPTHIALGTNATTPAASDTAALTGEVFRKAITRRIKGSLKITFQLFVSSTESNGFTISDARLVNHSGASVGDLYARALLIPSIVKTTSISITITWDVNYKSL